MEAVENNGKQTWDWKEERKPDYESILSNILSKQKFFQQES